MPANAHPRSARKARTDSAFPIGRFQVILLATSLALMGASWLLQGRMSSQDVAEYFIFTFIVGNGTRLVALRTARFYVAKSFPWDLLLLLFIDWEAGLRHVATSIGLVTLSPRK